MHENMANLIVVVITLWGVYKVFTTDCSDGKALGVLGAVALIAIAICGGGRSK